jgi:hypothetical protein
VSGGGCKERKEKERSTRPSRRIQWEPCQAAAGWRVKPIKTAKKVKVNATIKNDQVLTVSGGGWMERRVKPIKAAKKH